MPRFLSRLLLLRSSHQISQSHLAKELKVSRQTIAAIETGAKTPSLYTAFKIARFFGETVDSMFSFKETGK